MLGTAIVSSDADHRVVALRQHAACRAGQAARVAVLAHAHLVAGAQRRQATCIQIVRPLPRALVPRLARLGVAEARAGIEDHQRARHRRVAQMERQRHVAAQRQSTDHRTLGRRRRAEWPPCPRPWLLRNRRQDRSDTSLWPWPRMSHTITGTDRATPRSGRPTFGRSRCSRGTAGSWGLAHAPRNGSPRRRDRALPWPISSAPTAA